MGMKPMAMRNRTHWMDRRGNWCRHCSKGYSKVHPIALWNSKWKLKRESVSWIRREKWNTLFPSGFLNLELDSVFYQTEVVQSIKIGEVGRKIKHFLRRLVNQPKSPPNPSTFSLSSSSHLAIQQELCQEKLIFQVGKFVSERGGIF